MVLRVESIPRDHNFRSLSHDFRSLCKLKTPDCDRFDFAVNKTQTYIHICVEIFIWFQGRQLGLIILFNLVSFLYEANIDTNTGVNYVSEAEISSNFSSDFCWFAVLTFSSSSDWLLSIEVFLFKWSCVGMFLGHDLAVSSFLSTF